METEQYETSENMKQFFKNLEEIKLFLKENAHEHPKLQEALSMLNKTFEWKIKCRAYFQFYVWEAVYRL
ncbi:hypothetical protein [Chlamydia abortus]|uniref:hypothetical protein n=1 Tax=Chlamydia abortus TaxID=83555 RepID=UPI0011167EC5